MIRLINTRHKHIAFIVILAIVLILLSLRARGIF